jgi:hypothetical protein
MAIAIRDRTTPSQLAAVQSDGSILFQPQALTKGTQGANGLSTQDLKDAGRVAVAWTIDGYASVQATELMMTVTQSKDGAATTTNAGYTISTGKWFRIQHISAFLETTTGTAPQRCKIGIRFASAGSISTSSPLVWRGGLANISAITKSGISMVWEVPDGLAFLGDGTKQIGVSAIFPDWVTGTSVATFSMSLLAFEY